jgi:hypothetical protein
MSNIFQKIFSTKKGVNSAKDSKNKDVHPIKMNLKGQRVQNIYDSGNFNINLNEAEYTGKEKGPPMLNMRTRIKVWGALCLVGLYFYLSYRLIIFRLKADDLDLMEREVNEEFKLKKKIQELDNINTKL